MATQKLAKLEALQRWMVDALIFPGQVAPASIDARLRASPRQPSAARLAIYQRSFIMRLLQCMAEQFPALCHALGRELFDAFAREYLQACPPHSHTLYELGRRFPAYLETHRPDRDLPAAEREQWVDFMVDLAAYERTLFQMFDAPGHEGRPLATPATPDERLALQPCFELCRYRYDVAWYYHEVRRKQDPSLPPGGTYCYAIVRTDYQTYTHPLLPIHHRLLLDVRGGARIDEALRALAEATGRSGDELREAWTQTVRGPWIAEGFFVDRELLT